MIGLHEELQQREAEGRPVRVGLIGAGQMGTDVVATTRMMAGLQVVVTADIDITRAIDAYRIGQIDAEVVVAATAAEADGAVAAGKRVAVADFRIVTDMRSIDVMLESTGVPEIGARAALRSARSGHDLAMMNVETDITVGPILNWYAKQKGVLYALAAGDEPAACKELYDLAVSMGFTVVAAGKGKNNPLDRHATPTDPAVQRGGTPRPVPEHAHRVRRRQQDDDRDGCRVQRDRPRPDVRGMHGPATDRDRLNQTFALVEDGGLLTRTGVVDYGIGSVAPGVFLIVRTDHPRLREAMVLRDMGDGPNYTLFRPFHLCSIEVPLTCAMLAIRRRSNMVPLDRLVSEVFAVAKRDLEVGETLDAIGGTTYYSLIDTYETARAEGLLPIGLAKGARLIRAVAVDAPITSADVEIEPSTVSSLRQLQEQWFAGTIGEPELLTAVNELAND